MICFKNTIAKTNTSQAIQEMPEVSALINDLDKLNLPWWPKPFNAKINPP